MGRPDRRAMWWHTWRDRRVSEWVTWGWATRRRPITDYGLRPTTHHRKKGSQQSRKTPMMMPRVRAALCSAFHPLAGRTEPPVGADEEFRTEMKEGNWLIKFNSIRIDSLSVRIDLVQPILWDFDQCQVLVKPLQLTVFWFSSKCVCAYTRKKISLFLKSWKWLSKLNILCAFTV